jgi:short-subunit dehydrogenase
MARKKSVVVTGVSTGIGGGAVKVLVGKLGLPPETIGEAIATALTAAKPKVRYVVSPSPMRVLMTEILPKRTLDRITGQRLGLLPG